MFSKQPTASSNQSLRLFATSTYPSSENITAMQFFIKGIGLLMLALGNEANDIVWSKVLGEIANTHYKDCEANIEIAPRELLQLIGTLYEKCLAIYPNKAAQSQLIRFIKQYNSPLSLDSLFHQSETNILNYARMCERMGSQKFLCKAIQTYLTQLNKLRPDTLKLFLFTLTTILGKPEFIHSLSLSEEKQLIAISTFIDIRNLIHKTLIPDTALANRLGKQ